MSASSLSIPGPLFFFLAAMAAAAIAYLLHRWTLLSGLVAAASSLTLGWLAWQILLDKPLSLLGQAMGLERSFLLAGREWTLTPPALAVLITMFILAGLAFLLALPASQGWSFYSFGLSTLGILSLAVTAQQYLYMALLTWMATNLAVFVLSGGRPGATMGAFRFLVLTTLGVIPLLLLPRFLTSSAAPSALSTASVLMIIGFGVLFMMPPFHGQLVAAVSLAAPMAPAFILSAFPPVLLYIFSWLAYTYPVLLEDGLLFDLCRWLGISAVFIGGLAAPGQRRWGALIGYAVLADWGVGLIALGQGVVKGIPQATQMCIWRSLSLLLAGAGLTILFAVSKKDDWESSQGLFYRRPLNVLALVLGLLALSGFPLPSSAAAFMGGRWSLIARLMETEPQTAWLIILAGLGVTWGTLSGLRACIKRPAIVINSVGTFGPQGEMPHKERAEQRAERRAEMIGLAFGLFALGLAGAMFLYLGSWITVLGQAWANFTF